MPRAKRGEPMKWGNHPLGELTALPTLCVGQADDLKLEGEGIRIWLSRMTVEDGMPYENQVTVELLYPDGWRTFRTYEAV